MSHRHSIFCILPPHMLEQISQRGTIEQRDMAVRTLASSQQVRDRRFNITVNNVAGSALMGMVAATVTGKQRTIYDTKFSKNLPGTLVRNEGDAAVGDVVVNEAYDGSGATYDLYSAVYGRNSIDNRGLKIVSTVHFDKGYDNAFWNGQQMIYGDGDVDLPAPQQLFNRFTIAMDVIGHELTHGVTQYEANLTYSDQPGALNEAVSDIFGSLVKQYHLGQTADQADWIIGQGLLTANVNGVGIRSMKAPGTAYNDPVLGKDPQPAHMKDYVTTTQDGGGVHINSGIVNHAFYLTAIAIGGHAWEKAGQIWYKALTEKFQSDSSFQSAADLTFQAATEIFGAGSLEQNAVKASWAQVGIAVNEAAGGGTTSSGTTSTPVPGDGCLTAFLRAVGLTK